MILTLFLQGAVPLPPAYCITYVSRELRSKPVDFFITHFSICHSFLDSYIKGILAGTPRRGKWRERLQGRPGWHSRTVPISLRLK